MKIIDLIKISRPIVWFLFPLVFYIGLAVSGTTVSFHSILIIIMLSFPTCLAGYGINDVYDYKSDKINPRKKKKSIEGYIVSPKNRKFIIKISLFMTLLLFVSILLTGNILSIGVVLMFILFGYSYSAPPIRLKEKPPFDSISNAVIYILLPFSLGFSLSGSFVGFPLIKILFISLAGMAIHALSTIPDFTVDKKVRVTTFAVKFGKRNTAIFSLIAFLVTFFFGNFLTFIINAYLIFCASISFLLILFPSDRLGRLFVLLIGVGFVITAIFFLLGWLI